MQYYINYNNNSDLFFKFYVVILQYFQKQLFLQLSNKMITDKPLEIFGPWQVGPYEPPVAENGIVPRNAYGNVELFKECMLPIGTVHIKCK